MESAATAPAGLHHAPPVNLARFGMLTFLASEAMLFAGLICAYLVLWVSRGAAFRPDWAESWPVKLTGMNTVILVASSFTLLWGEKNVVKGKSASLPLFITTAMGATFVCVQAFEWTNLKNHENLWFNTAGTYSSTFFTLTGFHGLHVAIGVILLAVSLLMSLAGRFTPHKHSFLECASLYWHFVDVVWVFLFSILYVLPLFLRH
jgi:heme/copper-type cytochrome/quinol oxidase subunit 3